jgi:hypothetical protein
MDTLTRSTIYVFKNLTEQQKMLLVEDNLSFSEWIRQEQIRYMKRKLREMKGHERKTEDKDEC